MPIMSDQTLNLKRAAKDGYALILQWKDTTEESLTHAFSLTLPKNSRFNTKIICLTKFIITVPIISQLFQSRKPIVYSLS